MLLCPTWTHCSLLIVLRQRLFELLLPRMNRVGRRAGLCCPLTATLVIAWRVPVCASKGACCFGNACDANACVDCLPAADGHAEPSTAPLDCLSKACMSTATSTDTSQTAAQRSWLVWCSPLKSNSTGHALAAAAAAGHCWNPCSCPLYCVASSSRTNACVVFEMVLACFESIVPRAP